ncbi:alpha/beta hydrolase family protein [Streptomyces sp. NPDC051561]|uniref:alpha/beta hydrolase family protein n=1 Tax=Streptomyces sp. NPDC051561 TaxID=3365658 RepID=UPI0037B2BA38
MRTTTKRASAYGSWATRTIAAGAAAVLAALAVAPAGAAPPDPSTAASPPVSPSTATARPARVVSITPLGTRTRTQIVETALTHGFKGTEAEMLAVTRYHVTTYRLIYRTTAAATNGTPGTPTTASGLLSLPAVPNGPRAHRPLPTVLHTHGSMTFRGRAPSVSPQGPDGTAAQLFAAGGRAVLTPDYLGLGEGPGRHPFMDNASSVSATLDLLRAVRTLPAVGPRLSPRTYAVGFSQGGQVAMSVGRAVAAGQVPHARLAGLRSGAGPYDILNEEIPAMLAGTVPGRAAVLLLSYVITAQNPLSTPPLYRDPAEAFRAPYAARAEALFDGTHKEEEIIPQLPGSLRELFTDAWYEQLRNPSGPFLAAIRRIDTSCAWTSPVPVTLYSASGDHEAPIGNTHSCARQLKQRGVPVKVIDHGPTADHFGVLQHSVLDVARTFPTGT